MFKFHTGHYCNIIIFRIWSHMQFNKWIFCLKTSAYYERAHDRFSHDTSIMHTCKKHAFIFQKYLLLQHIEIKSYPSAKYLNRTKTCIAVVLALKKGIKSSVELDLISRSKYTLSSLFNSDLICFSPVEFVTATLLNLSEIGRKKSHGNPVSK